MVLLVAARKSRGPSTSAVVGGSSGGSGRGQVRGFGEVPGAGIRETLRLAGWLEAVGCPSA